MFVAFSHALPYSIFGCWLQLQKTWDVFVSLVRRADFTNVCATAVHNGETLARAKYERHLRPRIETSHPLRLAVQSAFITLISSKAMFLPAHRPVSSIYRPLCWLFASTIEIRVLSGCKVTASNLPLGGFFFGVSSFSILRIFLYKPTGIGIL